MKSPRLVFALIAVSVIAVFLAYRLSRPPQMPHVAPGAQARTVDAPDH